MSIMKNTEIITAIPRTNIQKTLILTGFAFLSPFSMLFAQTEPSAIVIVPAQEIPQTTTNSNITDPTVTSTSIAQTSAGGTSIEPSSNNSSTSPTPTENTSQTNSGSTQNANEDVQSSASLVDTSSGNEEHSVPSGAINTTVNTTAGVGTDPTVYSSIKTSETLISNETTIIPTKAAATGAAAIESVKRAASTKRGEKAQVNKQIKKEQKKEEPIVIPNDTPDEDTKVSEEITEEASINEVEEEVIDTEVVGKIKSSSSDKNDATEEGVVLGTVISSSPLSLIERIFLPSANNEQYNSRGFSASTTRFLTTSSILLAIAGMVMMSVKRIPFVQTEREFSY